MDPYIQENKHIFKYLFSLRETGYTNMFGAVPYIQETFDKDRRTSGELLQYWMNNFEMLSEVLEIKE